MSTQNNSAMLVKDVMLSLDKFPVIDKSIIFKEALEKMCQSRLGIACIVDADSKLAGILTDGDIRRKLLKVQKPFSAFFIDDAIEHALISPVTINPDDSLKEAIILMGEHQIWDLPIVDENEVLVGLLHLHPAVKGLLDL